MKKAIFLLLVFFLLLFFSCSSDSPAIEKQNETTDAVSYKFHYITTTENGSPVENSITLVEKSFPTIPMTFQYSNYDYLFPGKKYGIGDYAGIFHFICWEYNGEYFTSEETFDSLKNDSCYDVYAQYCWHINIKGESSISVLEIRPKEYRLDDIDYLRTLLGGISRNGYHPLEWKIETQVDLNASDFPQWLDSVPSEPFNAIVIQSDELQLLDSSIANSLYDQTPYSVYHDGKYVGKTDTLTVFRFLHNSSARTESTISVIWETNPIVSFISGSDISQISTDSSFIIKKPLDPSKDGFKFMWWSLNEAGEAFDFNTPITEDTNLYAVFKQLFTVTFVNEGLTSTVQVAYGEYAGKLNPTKTGYVLKGWSLTNGGALFDFDTTPITGNTTLYAVWEEI